MTNYYGDAEPARSLDSKGRCCGRKPLTYKREPQHRFCFRCNRAYDPLLLCQINNWAWNRRDDGQFAYITGTHRHAFGSKNE